MTREEQDKRRAELFEWSTDDLTLHIVELEAALAAEYRNLVFMVECNVIPNVLDDIIHTETRRVLGDKAEKLRTGK